MKRFLTLDAAETLIRVRWDPAKFVLDSAEACGLYLSEEDGRVFKGILHSRWKEYCAINETRDSDKGDAFWITIATEWLSKIGEDPVRGEELMRAGRPLLYSEGSPYFSLFPDVVPALDALERLHVEMAVVSNWDYSLHRILDMLGITRRFKVVLASLEEGVEKPDPRLFQIALDRLGARAEESVHVGDNPIDDLQGARNAGMAGLLIDRDRASSEGSLLHSLEAIPELLGWN